MATLAQAAQAGAAPAAGRTCGSCGLCCKLLGIEALEKPPGQWCRHWKAGKGCTIYGSHPAECREFACAWLEQAEIGDEWRPTRSRMVLYWINEGKRLICEVDPAFANAWRQQPYYDALKLWSRRGASDGLQVVVKIGDRLIAILPNKDVDLGVVQKGELIFIGQAMTPLGPDFVATKVAATGEPA